MLLISHYMLVFQHLKQEQIFTQPRSGLDAQLPAVRLTGDNNLALKWVSSVFMMSLLHLVRSSFTLITFSFYLLLDASSLYTKHLQGKICLFIPPPVDML